jgi:hypothetical protein
MSFGTVSPFTRVSAFPSSGCVSAWNKDLVVGVIGIQSGPRDEGPQWLPSSHGSRAWDADGGDDCEDPSRLFCSWSADQGDLPRAWRIAQSSRRVIRPEATEFRYERETQPLPKMGPWSAALDRLLAANESKDGAGTADADLVVRRTSRPGLCRRLGCGPSLCAAPEPGAWRLNSFSLCAAELCSRRSLPV